MESIPIEDVEDESVDDEVTVSDLPPDPLAFGIANSLAMNSWMISDLMRGVNRVQPSPINTATNTDTDSISKWTPNAMTKRKFQSICGTMIALPAAAMTPPSSCRARASLSRISSHGHGTRQRTPSFSDNVEHGQWG